MPLKITAKDQDNKDVPCELDRLPDVCPLCGLHGQPSFIQAVVMSPGSGKPVYGVFRCPVASCRALYIGTYGPRSSANTQVRLQGTQLARFVETHAFPKNVEEISSLFCKTYNQALTAEENGLDQICGPGYRKALEFLVKDYLVAYKYKNEPEQQEEVRKAFLGPAIENHIDQDRIKQCAKRAAWLGNDETHYTRKWEDKDIHDLKSLILITVNHIDLTIESDRYLHEMPGVLYDI